jgi:hypothetical protein
MSIAKLRQAPESALIPFIINKRKASWGDDEVNEEEDEGALPPPPPELPLLNEEDLRGYYRHPYFTLLVLEFYKGVYNLREGLSDLIKLFLLFFSSE